MNIVQSINEFSTNDIIFCEPIKNTIMDNSNFIRIIISNKDIIINGIYLFFNIKASCFNDRQNNTLVLDKHKYKKMLFNIACDENKELIDSLKKIERNILLKNSNNNKIKSFKLSNNLDEGFIKVFQEEENEKNNNDIKNDDEKTNLNKILFSETQSNNKKRCETIILKKTECKTRKVLLKISGIWENSTTYGITYKFLLT